MICSVIEGITWNDLLWRWTVLLSWAVSCRSELSCCEDSYTFQEESSKCDMSLTILLLLGLDMLCPRHNFFHLHATCVIHTWWYIYCSGQSDYKCKLHAWYLCFCVYVCFCECACMCMCVCVHVCVRVCCKWKSLGQSAIILINVLLPLWYYCGMLFT